MKKSLGGLLAAFAVVFGAILLAGAAQAAGGPAGQPHPWQLGLQDGVTKIKDDISSFHNLMLVIITAITILVMVLLLYVMVRYSAKSNPVPSRTSHNSLVEVVWTLVPVLILVGVAVPSLKLLYFQERLPPGEMLP